MTELQFLIITGMSGAGKTAALRIFEDSGFFCVDNLPPALITKFAELCSRSEGTVSRVALVIDIRGGSFFSNLEEELRQLERMGFNYQILFLEAAEEALINRYKESRRRHPLEAQGSILDAIRKERGLLEKLKGKASKIIDTTGLSVHKLKDELRESFLVEDDLRPLSLSLVSFGFKYGLPMDADLVFDVRFLPNPNYVSTLQHLSGKDQEVQDYLYRWPVCESFFSRLEELVAFLLPHYFSEGKSHLKIAVGCTGGRHRSVAAIEGLVDFLKQKSYPLYVEHRDIEKGQG